MSFLEKRLIVTSDIGPNAILLRVPILIKPRITGVDAATGGTVDINYLLAYVEYGIS
ncbi:MAG: hypothetical protein QW272_09700 [Candidatus Methanomethylicaceae archaeon]